MFSIIQGDIFETKVDVIVLTANPGLKLQGPMGDRAKEICGDRLEYELNQLKNPFLGRCVVTNAYNLPCKRIFHVATPLWQGGNHNEEQCLRDCYDGCLAMMENFELESIAFPLLSAGANGMPKSKAIDIAMEALSEYAKENEDVDILLVIANPKTWESYRKKMTPYIISRSKSKLSAMTKEHMEMMLHETRNIKQWYTKGTEKLLNDDNKPKHPTIGQMLLEFMKYHQLKQEVCYDGVISRTAWDNIIKGKSVPSRNTLVSLGVNMGLDEYEFKDLLMPIGETFNTYSNLWDAIVMEGMEDFADLEGDERIDEINKELVRHNFIPLKRSKN